MEFIEYDWDDDKLEANFAKHGYDFDDAWRVYEHPDKVTIADHYPAEERWRDLAEIGGKVRLLVYTMRGDMVRCISFRPATPSESKFFYEEITNR